MTSSSTPFPHFRPFRFLSRPGTRWGARPDGTHVGLDADTVRAERRAPALPRRWLEREYARRAAAVLRRARDWHGLPAASCLRLRVGVQSRLACDGLAPGAVDLACSLVVDAARRTLRLQPRNPQVRAALAMLDDRLVEMASGEGKSLAAAMAAAIGALAGLPVHVLTANDHLAEREAHRFAPLFAMLGLPVAVVTADLPPEARRPAYAASIVYATAQALASDHLRDRLVDPFGHPLGPRIDHRIGEEPDQRAGPVRGPRPGDGALLPAADESATPLLRGLHLAIVDDADGLVIDEAQQPLRLSRFTGSAETAAERAYLWQAWALSAQLAAPDDFRPGDAADPAGRPELTGAGRAHLAGLSAHLVPAWPSRRQRDDTVALALTARHRLQRDRDYRVVDGPEGPRIDISGSPGGGLAEGRCGSRQRHALIALVAIKEGCRPEPVIEAEARITLQHFFRRYRHLGGTGATLHEARAELAEVYGADVVGVPRHRPDRRHDGPLRVFEDHEARWQALLPRVRGLVDAGRPVLIGCDSIGAARALSARLAAHGAAHALLDVGWIAGRHAGQDAKPDAERDGGPDGCRPASSAAHRERAQADLLAAAGHAGRITVSAGQAGRGADIVLDAAARAAGGLHVLSLQHNTSSRLDRQLAGRAGRHGDPGSGETWLALDADLFAADPLGRSLAGLWRLRLRDGEVRGPAVLRTLAWAAWQAAQERRARARRRAAIEAEIEADAELRVQRVLFRRELLRLPERSD